MDVHRGPVDDCTYKCSQIAHVRIRFDAEDPAQTLGWEPDAREALGQHNVKRAYNREKPGAERAGGEGGQGRGRGGR